MNGKIFLKELELRIIPSNGNGRLGI